MSEVCSAVPNDLIGYRNKAYDNDQDLTSRGKQLSRALEALLRSDPDPDILPAFDDVGRRLIDYASRKVGIDNWVGEVGIAFLSAGEEQVAARYGVPSSVLSYRGTDVVATDSGRIDHSLVDVLGQTGRDLAGQLKDAVEEEDRDRVREIIATLAIFSDDPMLTAEFFRALGPKELVLVLHGLDPDQDAKTLQLLDESLATATNSPDWDPDFTTELLSVADMPSLSGAPDSQLYIYNLLRYGVFSEDFLTKVADQYLFLTWRTEPFGAPAGVIFDALARNPAAASSYLMGDSPWFEKDPSGHRINRLYWLLGADGSFAPDLDPTHKGEWQGAYDSLANAALAADLAPGADHLALLRTIGDTGSDNVPNDFREAVTQLDVRYIDLFAPGDHTLTDDQKRRLFALAETTRGDGIDTDHAGALAGMIARWSRQHPPLTDPDDPAVNRWFQDVGDFFALWAAPQRTADISRADHDMLQTESVVVLTSFAAAALLAVPGIGEVVGGTVGATLIGDITTYVLAKGQDGVNSIITSGLEGRLKDVYVQASADARSTVFWQYLEVHPELVPPAIANDPSAVERYLGRLVAANEQRDVDAIDFHGDARAAQAAADLAKQMKAMQQSIDHQFLPFVR